MVKAKGAVVMMAEKGVQCRAERALRGEREEVWPGRRVQRRKASHTEKHQRWPRPRWGIGAGSRRIQPPDHAAADPANTRNVARVRANA